MTKKKAKWCYPSVKETPGGTLSGTILYESGDLCKTWPSIESTLYEYSCPDGNYEYLSGYIQSKPHKKPLPVMHVKNSVILEPVQDYSFESVATHKCTNGSYKKYRAVCTHTGDPYRIPPGYRLPDIPNLDDCHREALNFFASGCQPLIANWAVTLFEFGELVELAHAAWNAAKLFKKLFSERMPYAWGMYLRRLSRLDDVSRITLLTQHGTKELADAYLCYMFAVSPLIADIKKTFDFLDNVISRAAAIKRSATEPIVVRFSKDISSEFPVQTTSFPPLTSTTSKISGDDKFRVCYEAKYVASALASYSVKDLTEQDIAFKLKKKAFGFTDPLVLLWEVIPFSFVLDWVVNVGNFIKNLPDEKTFPYQLSNVTHSLKISQTNVYTTYTYMGTQYSPRISRQTVVWTDLIDYYKRSLDIPLTYSGLDISLPDVQQLKLALALGRQFFK